MTSVITSCCEVISDAEVSSRALKSALPPEPAQSLSLALGGLVGSRRLIRELGFRLHGARQAALFLQHVHERRALLDRRITRLAWRERRDGAVEEGEGAFGIALDTVAYEIEPRQCVERIGLFLVGRGLEHLHGLGEVLPRAVTDGVHRGRVVLRVRIACLRGAQEIIERLGEVVLRVRVLRGLHGSHRLGLAGRGQTGGGGFVLTTAGGERQDECECDNCQEFASVHSQATLTRRRARINARAAVLAGIGRRRRREPGPPPALMNA